MDLDNMCSIYGLKWDWDASYYDQATCANALVDRINYHIQHMEERISDLYYQYEHVRCDRYAKRHEINWTRHRIFVLYKHRETAQKFSEDAMTKEVRRIIYDNDYFGS